MGFPELTYVGYKARPIIAKPLDRLAQTVQNLDAKHQEAIKQQTAIESQLGQLDLNEVEDSWRTQYAQDVQTDIDNASKYGNYATALTTATKKVGQVMNDPSLRGRLNAQQEFKKFQSDLETAKIDKDTKERFKEQNLYSYEDKKDDKGNIIGGSRWEPKSKPVEQVDMTQLMGKALQFAAKDAGGGNTIYYMNEQGQPTTDANQSADGLPYYEKSGKFEALNKDKLGKSLQNIIANTPGAAASIAQDYDTAIWKTKKSDKGDLVVNEVTDDKGMLLTQEQYLQKRIDPFLKSATYYHGYSQTNPLAGMSSGAAKQRAALSGQDRKGEGLSDVTYTSAGMKTEQLASGSEIAGARNINRDSMAALAKDMGVIVKSTADGQSIYDAAFKQAAKTGKIVPKELIDNYTEWKLNEAKFAKLIPPNTGKDTKDGFEFTVAIDSGTDLSQLVAKGNKFAEKYVKQINDVFGDKAQTIMIRVPSNSTGEVIKDIDGTEAGRHRKLGLSIKKVNGEYYLALDRNNATNLMYVQKMANKYADKSFIKGLAGTEDTASFQALDKDGNVIPGINTMSSKAHAVFGGTNDNVYTEANKIYKDNINTEPKFVNTEVQSVGMEDVGTLFARDMVSSGKFPDQKSAIEMWNKTVNNNLSNYKADMGAMSVSVKGETYKNVGKGEDKNALWSTVQAIRAKNPNRVSVSFDKHTLATIITVAADISNEPIEGKYGNSDIDAKEEIRFILPDAVNSDTKTALMSDPEIRSANNLHNAAKAGINEIPLRDGYSLYSSGDRSYSYKTPYGSAKLGENEAAKLDIFNKKLDDVKYSVYASGGLNDYSNEELSQLRNGIMLQLKEILPNAPEQFLINNANDALRDIENGYVQ